MPTGTGWRDALAPLVDSDTLIVESTDFSHYLPQHEARRFDQQTLNVLASGSLDGIAALLQPQHADSVGALYIQTKLQKALFSRRAAGHRQRELAALLDRLCRTRRPATT